MTYDDIMEALSQAAWAAADFADDDDGAPASEIRNVAQEIDCLWHNRVTRAEFREWQAFRRRGVPAWRKNGGLTR